MIKFICILVFWIKFSHQQTVDVALLENDLQKATNLMISKEKKVSSTILSCKASAAIASKNLKAVNFNKSLTDALDVMANLTIELLTIKEFEGFTKCQNLTTCECITFRIVLLDTQIKKIDEISENINGNCSKFYESFSSLTWNFALNFKPIQFIWTREVSVLKTCNQSRLLLSEFSDFNRIVNSVKNFYVNVKSFMSSQTSNCSSGNSNFTEEGKQIDEKLREYQNQLLNLTTIALEKVNNSLNSVAAKKVKSSLLDSKSALKSLQNRLRKQETVDDYDMPTLTWPRIPDTSGASGRSFMKVRTTQAKKESYSFTRNAAARNKTKVKKDLDAFKASANTSSGISKRSITLKSTAQELDVITATTNVVNYFDVYIQKLNSAIIKVENMTRIYEQEMLGCSSIYQIKNSNNETVKNLCYRRVLTSVNDALTSCQSQGMELFGITSVDDFNGILTIFSSIFGLKANPFIITNGIYNQTLNRWFVQYASSSRPLYPAAIPSSNSPACSRLLVAAEGIRIQNCACNLTAFYFCEYGSPSAPPPVIAPNTSVCTATSDIKTVTDLLIKRICRGPSNLAANDARAFCQSQGMEYYGITNYDDYFGLLKFHKSLYPSGGLISINGIYDAPSKKWLVKYKTKTVELFPAAIPTSSTSGCLAIPGELFQDFSCTQNRLFFCEYDQTEARSPITQETWNIIDSSGNVSKKAAVIRRNLRYSDALNYCLLNGFSGLFAVRDAGEFTSLKALLVNISLQMFGTCNGVRMNLGAQRVNGKWLNFNTDQTALFSGAIPTNVTGEVLQMLGHSSGFFDPISVVLLSSTWFVCENDVRCRPPPAKANNVTFPLPCGTFLPYDPVNGRLDPEDFGFPAGIRGNDIQYVGYGLTGTGSCANYSTFPGFVSTANGSAGAYMTCFANLQEIYTTNNVSYLAWSSKLAWVDATFSTLGSIANRITLRPNGGLFNYGRMCLNGQIQVGRIHAGASIMFINNQQVVGNANFQVLVCNP